MITTLIAFTEFFFIFIFVFGFCHIIVMFCNSHVFTLFINIKVCYTILAYDLICNVVMLLPLLLPLIYTSMREYVVIFSAY